MFAFYAFSRRPYWQQHLVILFGAVVISAVLFYLFIHPLRQQIKEVKQSVNESSSKHAALLDANSRLVSVAVSPSTDDLITAHDNRTLTSTIMGYVNASGATLIKLSHLMQVQDIPSWSLQLACTYPALLRLIKSITESEYLLHIHQLRVTRIERGLSVDIEIGVFLEVE